MKRIFLLFFSALLCTAVSAHSFEVDGIYYKITSSSDLTVGVTYRGSSYNEYSDEYSVSVVIPDKVTYDSKKYSVTSIGSSAFDGCSGLTSVRIEDCESTLPLSNSTFYSCPLTTLYLGRNISYTVSNSSTPFSGKKELSAVTIGNNVTNIGEYLFYGCSALTSVTIPESCKTIQRSAFRDCI